MEFHSFSVLGTLRKWNKMEYSYFRMINGALTNRSIFWTPFHSDFEVPKVYKTYNHLASSFGVMEEQSFRFKNTPKMEWKGMIPQYIIILSGSRSPPVLEDSYFEMINGPLTNCSIFYSIIHSIFRIPKGLWNVWPFCFHFWIFFCWEDIDTHHTNQQQYNKDPP